MSLALTSDVKAVTLNNSIILHLQSGASAFDALKEASNQDSCFRFRVKMYSFGPYIEGICNVEQNKTAQRYWMFYVNGKMAKVGVGSYKVQQNDNITFKYTQMVSKVFREITE